MKTKDTNWLPNLVIIFLAVLLIVLHVRLYRYAYDDSYIHFRIARNFLENGHPYFNDNEMIKVSTSSGWTLFLIILLKFTQVLNLENHFPLFVSVSNACTTLCATIIYTKIIETLQEYKLSLSTKLLFQIPFIAVVIPVSIGLMETPLALLLAGFGIYFIIIGKSSGFALLGFATYIRIELLILIVLAIPIAVFQKKLRFSHIIGYIGIGTAPLLVYDLYFFGTAIPHSIIAKSLVYSISWIESVKYILFYSLPVVTSNYNYILFSGIMFFGTIIFTATLIFGEQNDINGFWHYLFFIWGLLIISGYIFGHTHMFQWYVPLYMTPILVTCFLTFTSNVHSKNIIKKTFIYVLFLISAISIAKSTYASIDDPSLYGNFVGGSRVNTYLKTGKILFEEYPQATLLTSEIGALGYSFKGEILDAAGLASLDALEFHPMKIPEQRENGSIGTIPPGYVKIKMPDLIVSYDYFTQSLLRDDVVNLYNMILIPAYLPEDAQFSKTKTIAGNKFLRIYIRKDLHISERITTLEQ